FEVEVLDADPRRVKRLRIALRKERPAPRTQRERGRREAAPETAPETSPETSTETSTESAPETGAAPETGREPGHDNASPPAGDGAGSQ
ncbi:MAG: magnesium/cobalt efflux protein, partial [Bradyrhizobium sp.]